MTKRTQFFVLALSLSGSSYAIAQKADIEYTEEDKKIASEITGYDKERDVFSINTDKISKYNVTQIRRATRYTVETQKTSPVLVPTDWPGCKCDSPVVLAAYDFENITGTVPSAPASSTASGISAGSIAGPGSVTANPVGGTNFGCFGGFASDGGAGTIGFTLTNNSSPKYCLSDITFDYFTEGSELGAHGPDQFIVQIGDGSSVFWQTETINSGIGSANIGNFSMGNQQGSQLVSGSDWLEFVNGENYVVQIIASGSNNDRLGFDIDNVQVHACPVPEPSSSLLVLLGSGFVLVRRKR